MTDTYRAPAARSAQHAPRTTSKTHVRAGVRTRARGDSPEMVSVISCGDPEGEAVGPAACANTWLRLELLMVTVISWGPVEVDTRPCDVIT